MSGQLNHSPGVILQQLLIDLLLGTVATDNLAWPVFYSVMPNAPDNAISVHDTTGRMQGRDHNSGEMTEKYGFQVRVRCGSRSTGDTKAQAIGYALDTGVNRTSVTVGSDTYLVQSITRTTPVLSIGLEQGSRNRLWTLNAVASITIQPGTGTGTGTGS